MYRIRIIIDCVFILAIWRIADKPPNQQFAILLVFVVVLVEVCNPFLMASCILYIFARLMHVCHAHFKSTI